MASISVEHGFAGAPATTMVNTGHRPNTRYSRRSTRRWLRKVLGILAGAALAGGVRAYVATDRVLVAADWDGDPSVVPLAAGFINPSNTTSGPDRNRRIVWAPVPGAEAYKIVIGTAAGASDVLDSGPLTSTSYEMPGSFQSRRVLYARLWTKVGGVWRARDASRHVTDITFTMSPPQPDGLGTPEPEQPHE
jgi:hypothetical protein